MRQIESTFASLARDLAATLDRVGPRLQEISPEWAAEPRAPGKWSRTQVLGHLVDSAANNHLRFVRAGLGGQVTAPDYAADPCVRLNGYQEHGWEAVRTLWEAYNRLLVRLVAALPPSAVTAPCTIGNDPPVTLQALVADYIRHLEHHLAQVVDGT